MASRYKGVNYIFQGLSLKGREQARQQVRHAMNTWYYPGVSAKKPASPNNGLILGAGRSTKSGKPTISGTFIADKKDYWGGNFYYRIYQFSPDGTFTSGSKHASSGKVKMHSQRQHWRINKTSNGKYVFKSGRTDCTDGFVTDIRGNEIKRFKSGCYTSSGKAMYFDRIE